MIETEGVRKLPRFSGVDPAAQDWLAERITRRMYRKGQLLFTEGEEPADLWLVERGVVKVFQSLESGRELIIGLFRFGDAIGEVAVIDRSPYPASAAAQEAATMLVLPAAPYFEYLRSFEGAALAAIRDLTLRMRVMQERMKDLGGGGVEYRIARVLRALATTEGKDGNALRISASLTRQDLADMVGARVETVIRIMSRWQKDGLLEKDETGLRLPNRLVLDRLADES